MAILSGSNKVTISVWNHWHGTARPARHGTARCRAVPVRKKLRACRAVPCQLGKILRACRAVPCHMTFLGKIWLFQLKLSLNKSNTKRLQHTKRHLLWLKQTSGTRIKHQNHDWSTFCTTFWFFELSVKCPPSSFWARGTRPPWEGSKFWNNLQPPKVSMRRSKSISVRLGWVWLG